MNRRLLTVGSIFLLATAMLWLAGSAGWIPGITADSWSGLTLKGSLITFGAALLGRLLSPVSNLMSSGRCKVCGRRTERGHLYCLDHLRETVNATRDRTRDGGGARPRPTTLPRSRV